MSDPPVVLENLSLGDNSVGTTEDAQSPRLSAIVIEETMNLLEEDDENAEKTTTSANSANASASTAKKAPAKSKTAQSGEAVSVERKEELLLEARVNRLQWIHQVPLPYRKAESPDDPWVQEQGLANFLKNCHAAAMMPSMTTVLGHLYGMNDNRVAPEDVAMRIENLIGSLAGDDDPIHSFVRPGQKLLETEIARNPNNQVLTSYKEFWTKLQSPECASLVQGMRTAIRNLDSIDEPRSPEELAGRFQSYLTGSYETLKAHAAWRNSGTTEETKHALESFIYGQCHSLIQSKLRTDETKKAEDEFNKRLETLQFVTPKHLDITCLEDLTEEELEDDLKSAKEALLLVDFYFSPYEKLQRILDMYRGINAALTKALNKGETKGKMPSADDVLPTIILTVLKAKPARIHTNLRMVELFCPQEYLRGEAGYATTNLFGAVQFLLDLELNAEAPKSLSITAEEFRKGLEESRAKSQQRLDKMAHLKKIDTDIDLQFCDIPASVIREARARGEKVDLDWALKWQQEQMEKAAATASGQSTSEEVLPPGFSRTYTFLTARPEDIRMSDLPQLLAEYRMLVHTAESLMGERAARMAADRKKKVNTVQEELLANVRLVDPSLLPENQPSSQS